MTTYASLKTDEDSFAFAVDPYEVTWGNNLRTQTTDTYGGKVVQVLGVNLTSLNVSVVAGSRGYKYVSSLMKYFKDTADWCRNTMKPAKFVYPKMGYNLSVWPKSITYQDQVGNVVYPIDMTFEIEEDLAGNVKKSTMLKELSRLAEGIGYTKSVYNYPTAEDEKELDDRAAKASSAISMADKSIGEGYSYTEGSLGSDPSLTADQQSNAQAIISVALSRNLGRIGAVIGIMTAITESTLHNVDHGDAMGPSSCGLFQQMPKYWGGNRSVNMDPKGSAGLFYDALVKVPNWNTRQDIWMVAQTVQQSEFKDGSNYKKNQAWAISIVDKIMIPGGNAGKGQTAVAAAKSQIGVPYSWGGGGPAGPSLGIAQGANTVGFDCSGLTEYAWAKAGVSIGGDSRTQYANIQTYIAPADISKAQPGDLMFFSNNMQASGIHHVAIFVDQNTMIEAPYTGVPVRLRSPLRTSDLLAIKRPQ